ncbi:MAG: RNA-binding protein, partial [Cytophagales bacterium]
CTYNGEKSYPMVLRHDLLSQIPSLKKKFLKYESYKDATIIDVFAPEQLKSALKLEATNLATSVLLNNGKGHFSIESLPIEAQFSPFYAILIDDIDRDGNLDLLLGGNLYRVKPEVGRYDASSGTFLKGDGNGKFKTVLNRDCGLMLDGEVRDIKRIKVGKNNLIMVARNNDTPIFLKVND